MAEPDREPLIWLWASSGRTGLRVPQAEPPDYQPACVSLNSGAGLPDDGMHCRDLAQPMPPS